MSVSRCLNLSPSDEDMREKGIGLYFGTGSLRLLPYEKRERAVRRAYRSYLRSLSLRSADAIARHASSETLCVFEAMKGK